MDLRPARWRTPAFAAAMALLIVPNLVDNQPGSFHVIDPLLWTPRQIAARGLEATTASEYAPRWMEVMPDYSESPMRIVAGSGAEIQELRRSPVSWSGRIHSNGLGVAQLSIAWFPGWEVRIDGAPSAAGPAERTGLIRFDIPPGTHTVEAVWRRTGPRLLGDALTLAALAVVLVLVGIKA